jgi:hypothetical protein
MIASKKDDHEKPDGAPSFRKSSPWKSAFMKFMNGSGSSTQTAVQAA